ncbi:hypothetical protein F5972_05035 [Microbispora cellulosiformans]|uniref:Lipoprotein n=1 Tax=Microbispora cellulosiformans TaxID=2614688 RepID=A0A5J5K9I8_9ACTN|nr:hypothetical protein [Microbispora cellulosiformans]KAA9380513.1 hypothetical protein F5972_05035 [Microbispora cellulosiformans]
MPYNPRVLALSVLALVGSVSGCGASVAAVTGAEPQPVTSQSPALSELPPTSGPPMATSTAEPSVGAIPHIRDARPVPMPLDRYMTAIDDVKRIDKARDIAAAECMRRLGFTNWTADTIRTWDPADYTEYDYVEYLDPDLAAKSGYPRPAVGGASVSALREDGRRRHEPTKEERNAFEGGARQTAAGKAIPAGGCVEDASSRIHGGEARLPVDPRSLAVDSRLSALHDSRVREAFAAWSACMARHGLPYPDPVLLRNDPRWASREASEPAGEEERKTAFADATCQAEVNLVGVYKTIRAAYEQSLVEQNKTKLAEAGPVFEDWVDNAKALIESNGS